MAITPVLTLPTSAPVALGGTTPAVLLAQGAGLLAAVAAAGKGSTIVKVLKWIPALSAWDYVVMNGQRESITPDSKVAGGVDSENFDVPIDAYHCAYVTVDPPSNSLSNLTVDISGQAATGTGTSIMSVGPVAAPSNTAVHAAYAADQPNTFPGPITNPDVPRNLIFFLSAPTYDGGIITVTGTDQFDAAQVETYDTAGGSGPGLKIFKTVTSITKSVVGATTDTISIGRGSKIGLPKHLTASTGAIVIEGTNVRSAVIDNTRSAFTPTPAPAASTYTVIAETTA